MGERRVFGTAGDRDVEEVVLRSEAGVSVAVLTYGALIRDWRVPVGGERRAVVLGFDAFEPYLTESPYFGAICGRLGNRVGGAQFTLDGTTYRLDANEGPHQLHGGSKGFAHKVWTIAEQSESSVTLTLVSPEGEMGYPGTLDISLTYRLSGYRLELFWQARTDKATPVNIVQHNYFNLAGTGDVLDHELAVAGTAVTELDAEQIPNGRIVPVQGTELDFTAARTLRDAQGRGIKIDHNFVLPTRREIAEPVVSVVAPDGSLTLTVQTDQKGLQVYNGWKIKPGTIGLDGRTYGPFSGLCLEDQNFPDAINHKHFPDPVITPQKPYRHWCAIEIKP